MDISSIQLVMLSIPTHRENLAAVKRLKRVGYKGLIVATALFSDEVEELQNAGVTAAFNFYSEAGTGFADHICSELENQVCGEG